MKRRALYFIAVLATAGLCVAFAFQREAISDARAQNTALRLAEEERARLAAENLQLSMRQSAGAEIEALRASNQPLPGLRNLVRKLRAEKTDMEKLRAENQRLAAATPQAKLARLSEMEGYVAKEMWTRAGFATPESTVQTWFWAAGQGDIQQFADCMSPQMREEFLRQFVEKSPEEQQKAFAQSFRPLLNIGGYRIAHQESVSENKVILGIQAAAGGHVMKVPVERFGTEWKLHEPK